MVPIQASGLRKIPEWHRFNPPDSGKSPICANPSLRAPENRRGAGDVGLFFRKKVGFHQTGRKTRFFALILTRTSKLGARPPRALLARDVGTNLWNISGRPGFPRGRGKLRPRAGALPFYFGVRVERNHAFWNPMEAKPPAWGVTQRAASAYFQF